MKKNRILSAALAGVMTMALSVPAFAAATNTETAISATYTAPTIAVVVPATNTAFINPYGLGTTVTKSDSSKVNVLGEIVSTPSAIENRSAYKLKVSATVTGVVPDTSAVKFAATTTDGTGTEGADGYIPAPTTKSVFVKFQMIKGTGFAGKTDAAVDGKDEVIDEFVANNAWSGAAAKEIVVAARETTANDILTLEEATMDANGDFASFKNGSVALYRLTGDCVESPREAWAAADTFTVNVAYTFKPDTSTP